MAEETKDEQLLHRLFEQISEHIETRLAYFSLTATEKASGIAAYVVGAIIVFVFSLLVLFFFIFGLAWWLGDLIGHRAGGFVLTGLIFIPIAAIVFFLIRPFVRKKVIQSILADESTKKQSDDEKPH